MCALGVCAACSATTANVCVLQRTILQHKSAGLTDGRGFHTARYTAASSDVRSAQRCACLLFAGRSALQGLQQCVCQPGWRAEELAVVICQNLQSGITVQGKVGAAVAGHRLDRSRRLPTIICLQNKSCCGLGSGKCSFSIQAPAVNAAAALLDWTMHACCSLLLAWSHLAVMQQPGFEPGYCQECCCRHSPKSMRQ